MLNENSVDIMNAPLDAFDSDMASWPKQRWKKGVADDELDEIGEKVFNASQPRFGKRSGKFRI